MKDRKVFSLCTTLLFLTFLISPLFMSGCDFLTQVPAYTFQKTDLEDSDKDGVISGRDLWPDTPGHKDVNNGGCPLKEHHIKETKYMILLEHNDCTVDGGARKVAAVLRENPDCKLKITDYTSLSGPSGVDVMEEREI